VPPWPQHRTATAIFNYESNVVRYTLSSQGGVKIRNYQTAKHNI